MSKNWLYSSKQRVLWLTEIHYYGFKLHVVCSIQGVFQSLDISPASVHDIHYLKNIKRHIKECILLRDNGYLSAEHQLDLLASRNTKLEIPIRKNQNNHKDQPYVIRKTRKRIETLFSQLCEQFMIGKIMPKIF